MARTYRVSRRQRIWLVELPAALPGIVGGLRIGITLAVVGAIVAEWAGGELGLGVLINLARGSLFDIPLLFATLALIAFVGIALYTAVLLVERRVVTRV
jgi:NitT/TauT family transport system permease protein